MEDKIEQLYIAHSDIVYRYIYWLVRNKEIAEDLTQDTFYKAFKNLNNFKEESSESTWLLKIARHVTYDYFRRKKVIRFLSLGKEANDEITSFTPESSVLHREEILHLYASLNELKKDYRDVLILRKIEECSIKETAYILNWTEAKVKTKLARAFEALKEEYNRKDGFLNEPIK